jgi:hypothetical protein
VLPRLGESTGIDQPNSWAPIFCTTTTSNLVDRDGTRVSISIGSEKSEHVPTILRINGFRVYFYSHEPAEPPHVHVDRGGATAKVWLQPVAIASNAGFPARELADVLFLVRTHQQMLSEAWYGFFDAGGDG